MSKAVRILPYYTYEDYRRWEGKWEIINGIAYDMSPSPAPKHQYLAGEIHSLFRDAIRLSQCKDCKVYQPLDLKVTEDTILNPDILIVCKPIEKMYIDFPPELVVEIISPSTRLKDLHTKYDIYENFGIKYYIIIDPENNSLMVHCLSNDNKYLIQRETPFHFTFQDNCKLIVDLHKIWDSPFNSI